ncbi:MAG: hypothetical protein COS49_02140 [Candidatus Portnoybacteria bacterium CG03_land_8_20_14_0_80_41_10]|uniref:Uncharacterized protein n=1 Tax=Candidatus Portnoybacteria bacterium CG03_land_8_20_14_0_80_41_10 TaxID=1974808 RepID=A0A2M7BU88_9BACT|nr:MAG: hypothetical protein COS49_02140 [Candidatus Portnoybacteria bacterium CG03_land_8_20_14_0_80_41_10]
MNEQNSLSPLADTSKKEIKLTSRKKWLWLGIVVAIINPVFAGLILGLAFWTEPEMKKEAKIILAVAIIWGAIYSYLVSWLTSQGYLPAY